jgi:hypothetical protein
MKINEIITEGVWDNLKTAGQNVKQRVGTVGQTIKQGAGAVANRVGQTYQQTMQARQQRFDQQAAAQQFKPRPGWTDQGQLRAKNAGTFMGDVAKTIAGASPSTSYFTPATNTTVKNTIPPGTKLETQFGEYTMTDQGWIDDTNKPVKDAKTINGLNTLWANSAGGAQANPKKPADPAAPAPVVSPGGLLGPGGKPIQYDEKGVAIVAQ